MMFPEPDDRAFDCPDCLKMKYADPVWCEAKSDFLCTDCADKWTVCACCQGDYHKTDLFSNGWCIDCLREHDKLHLFYHEIDRTKYYQQLRIA